MVTRPNSKNFPEPSHGNQLFDEVSLLINRLRNHKVLKLSTVKSHQNKLKWAFESIFYIKTGRENQLFIMPCSGHEP